MQLMSKTFEAVSSEYENKGVSFVKVDTEVHDEVVQRYQVQGLPLLAVYRGGEMVATHCGALTKDRFREFLQGSLPQ